MGVFAARQAGRPWLLAHVADFIGRRLAASPAGTLTEAGDSCTLIPLDQPARLAQLIREFKV